MPHLPARAWLLLSLAAIGVAGTATLALLESRCGAEGGTFTWATASCEKASRPIILQGDIHRV